MSRALRLRPGPAPGGGWWWALRFGAAFLLLNTLLTFDNRWPGLGVAYTPRLSFELCVGVAVLALWVARRGAPGGRTLWALTFGFVALVAARYVDVTAPAVMGRPVHVYWDGRHVGELMRVATQSWSIAQVSAALGAVALAGTLLLMVVRASMGMLAQCLVWTPAHRWLWAGVAVLSLVFAAYVPEQRDTRWFFSVPVMPTLVKQGVLMSQVLMPERAEAALGSGPAFDTDVSALRDDAGPLDVVIVFAESYGATTLDNPQHNAALQAPLQRLADAIDRSGRSVVSGRVQAPTFGGASWLSHAALLSGLDTSDPARHSLLLTSQRPTLVSHFARHGYRTVGWMPGIKRPWPEGAFYGFDHLADDARIGYQGPDFGYWRIPDQASMALLDQKELQPESASLAPRRQPVFAVFPTVTTHAPFHPLPPVLSDPRSAALPRAYTQAQVDAAMGATASLQGAELSYLQSMGNQFDWLAHYVDKLASQRLVLIVIGDHQPPGLVSGRNASWDVPVHVISAHPPLLRRFEAIGLAPGLRPHSDSLGPMHSLTHLLLQVLDERKPVDMDSAQLPLTPTELTPDMQPGQVRKPAS